MSNLVVDMIDNARQKILATVFLTSSSNKGGSISAYGVVSRVMQTQQITRAAPIYLACKNPDGPLQTEMWKRLLNNIQTDSQRIT